MEKGVVFDVRRYAVHDGPGIRTTVFLKGCPLSCWWCHNPESQGLYPELMLQPKLCIQCGLCHALRAEHACVVSAPVAAEEHQRCAFGVACATLCPTGARMRSGKEVTVTEIMRTVLRDRPFYDQSGGGVTFSGGEPFAQPHFLMELLRQCEKEEISTAVDTSGYTEASWIRLAAQYKALFLYDVKLIDNQKHVHYTGVSNAPILANAQLLSELGANVIVRVPIIPGINDGSQDIDALGQWLSGFAMRWPIELLPYHNLPEGKYVALSRSYCLQGLEAPTAEHMQSIEAQLLRYGLPVSIRG